MVLPRCRSWRAQIINVLYKELKLKLDAKRKWRIYFFFGIGLSWILNRYLHEAENRTSIYNSAPKRAHPQVTFASQQGERKHRRSATVNLYVIGGGDFFHPLASLRDDGTTATATATANAHGHLLQITRYFGNQPFWLLCRPFNCT